MSSVTGPEFSDYSSGLCEYRLLSSPQWPMKWVIWYNVYPVSQHGVVRVSLAGHTFPRAGRPVAKLLSLLHVVEIAAMSKALLTKSMVFMSEEPTASRIRYQPLCPFRDGRTWSGKFSWPGYMEHGPNMCTGASRAPTECGQSSPLLQLLLAHWE